jgi:hypothetical protein
MELVATRRGAHPHHDGGAAVRQVFHQLRSKSIEPFNGLFKGVFAWRVKMPVKGISGRSCWPWARLLSLNWRCFINMSAVCVSDKGSNRY